MKLLELCIAALVGLSSAVTASPHSTTTYTGVLPRAINGAADNARFTLRFNEAKPASAEQKYFLGGKDPLQTDQWLNGIVLSRTQSLYWH